MRTAIAVMALMLVVLAAVPAASAQTSQKVSIAVTTALVIERGGTRSDVLLLWNRNERSKPIGHGVKSCIRVGSGGLLGGGIMTCTLVLQLPLGKLVAAGIVHNVHRYTLAVTGGTGRYVDTKGPLFVRQVTGNGVRRLTFVA